MPPVSRPEPEQPLIAALPPETVTGGEPSSASPTAADLRMVHAIDQEDLTGLQQALTEGARPNLTVHLRLQDPRKNNEVLWSDTRRPLIEALHRDSALAHALLAAGADPTQKDPLDDTGERSTLGVAVLHRRWSVVERLLDARIPVSPAESAILIEQALLDAQPQVLRRCLGSPHWASPRDRITFSQDGRASPLQRLLHRAVHDAGVLHAAGMMATLDLVLEQLRQDPHPGSTTIDSPGEGVHGVTALALAVDTGSAPLVQRLLDEGADPNATFERRVGESDPFGALEAWVDSRWTALHQAAESDRTDIARLLLERGAHSDARTTFPFTPLEVKQSIGQHQRWPDDEGPGLTPADVALRMGANATRTAIEGFALRTTLHEQRPAADPRPTRGRTRL